MEGATTATHHQRTLSTNSTDDLFASINGPEDSFGDEDLDLLDEANDNVGDLKGGGAKKLKRLPSSTAEKKATHNAVERARRESLNGRFLVLADLLPGMTHVKRASKAAIVNKSIELIKELQATETKLANENAAIKQELAALRQHVGNTMSASPTMFQQNPNALPPMAMNGMPHSAPASIIPLPALLHHHQQQQQQQHAQAQAQAQAQAIQEQQSQQQHAHLRRDSAPQIPLFPGVFNGLFHTGLESLDTVRSDSGSPSHNNSSANNFFQNVGDYFQLGQATNNSVLAPAQSTSSHNNRSPSINESNSPLASFLAASSSAAAKEYSSSPTTSAQSLVGTPPMNSYSPTSTMPSLKHESGASPSSVSSAPNTANSALLSSSFDEQAAAAVSASMLGAGNPFGAAAASMDSRDLAKATMELQQFIAFQRLAAGMTGPPNAATANGSGASQAGNPFAYGLPAGAFLPPPQQMSQHMSQQQLAAATAAMQQAQSQAQQSQHIPPPPPPFCGSMNIPAWQLMMAQQHALTTFGSQNHY